MVKLQALVYDILGGRCRKAKLGVCSVVSRFGLAVRSVRLVSRGTSVRIPYGSSFSSKVVVCGHGLNCDFVSHN